MQHPLFAFAGVAMFVAGLGAASAQPGLQAPKPPSMATSAPAPAPASTFLGPDELAPAQLLPPPPGDGSPQARAELAELHRFEKARTAADLARARTDDAREDVTAFRNVVGPGFQLERLPATARLFADLRAEDSAAAKRAKAYFQRTRPWAADPTLHPCPHGDDKVTSAYPSGHATMAYAAAGVLARLDPPKAQAILARAADYAENRLVCGAHYRRDIVAGQTLGTALALALIEKPAFRAEFDAAAAELRQAGVIN